MAQTGPPFIISFVIRRTGGRARWNPTRERDNAGSTAKRRVLLLVFLSIAFMPPLGGGAGGSRRLRYRSSERLLTFRANTADCEVEDIEGSAELIIEPPLDFAENLGRLRNRFTLRVAGGCCGTEGGHIEALAKKLSCEEV